MTVHEIQELKRQAIEAERRGSLLPPGAPWWVYIVIMGLLVTVAFGCTPRPYVVCDEGRCTRPMTHEETVRAAEINKAWEAESLHVEVAP